jgi:hypothetical protein
MWLGPSAGVRFRAPERSGLFGREHRSAGNVRQLTAQAREATGSTAQASVGPMDLIKSKTRLRTAGSVMR